MVAWNFAVAQPLLELLGRNPEFFVAHRTTKFEILVVAVGLTLLVPLALAALLTAFRAGRAACPGRFAHRVVLGLLVAEFVLQLVKAPGGTPSVLESSVPVVLGLVVAWLYDRRAGWRASSWWLLPAPVLFLVLFVSSPVSSLIFTTTVEASTGVALGLPKPVVMIVFDEMPVVSIMAPDGSLDRTAYPELRAARGPLDVVPQHHRRLVGDREVGAHHPDRPNRHGAGAHRVGEPRERLHDARRTIDDEQLGACHQAVSRDLVSPERRRPDCEPTRTFGVRLERRCRPCAAAEQLDHRPGAREPVVGRLWGPDHSPPA